MPAGASFHRKAAAVVGRWKMPVTWMLASAATVERHTRAGLRVSYAASSFGGVIAMISIRMSTRIGLVLSGIAGAALLPSAGYAASRFGVVCVGNQTSTSLSYRAEVGNGAWATYTISPGARRAFWHEYTRAGEDSSPPLRIQFDSDLRSQRTFAITYRLPRRAAARNSCEEGKQYAFQYEPSNRAFIDLKALR
jgi:hypothetical protein